MGGELGAGVEQGTQEAGVMEEGMSPTRKPASLAFVTSEWGRGAEVLTGRYITCALSLYLPGTDAI